MRKRLLAIAVSALAIWTVGSALAEQAKTKKTHPMPAASHDGKKPAKSTRAPRSCAEYGAGFVRAADSETCVKVGGSISTEVGR